MMLASARAVSPARTHRGIPVVFKNVVQKGTELGPWSLRLVGMLTGAVLQTSAGFQTACWHAVVTTARWSRSSPNHVVRQTLQGVGWVDTDCNQ
jgi:hypothetical protein